jgi:GNAT superfamily N-acetyltransferase
MSALKSHYFRIRWLEIEGKLIALPFGFPLQKNDLVELDGDKVILFRKSHTQKIESGQVTIPDSRSQIFPHYIEEFTLKDGSKLTVQPVFSFEDWQACRQIEHYLNWPSSGAYFCAKKEGKVVGVLVLARFPNHMRPSWRRELEKGHGKDLLEALWIRRIAVDKDFHDNGIGKSLARAAMSIGRSYWLPRPCIIELISTIGDHHFLTQVGYIREELGKYGYLTLSRSDGETIKQHIKRYYYWYDLSNNQYKNEQAR